MKLTFKAVALFIVSINGAYSAAIASFPTWEELLLDTLFGFFILMGIVDLAKANKTKVKC
jgi:hypothetical protein